MIDTVATIAVWLAGIFLVVGALAFIKWGPPLIRFTRGEAVMYTTISLIPGLGILVGIGLILAILLARLKGSKCLRALNDWLSGYL